MFQKNSIPAFFITGFISDSLRIMLYLCHVPFKGNLDAF